MTSRAARAREAAAAAGFAQASDEGVGRLLTVLAATVPAGGRVLELGTGTGVGTAAIVDGLRDRTDVEVVTVDADAAISARAEEIGWPPCVRFVVGDAVELLRTLGRFDLVFADAPGGKWVGLDRTIDALAPGGLLVVDDLDDPAPQQAVVAETLLGHPHLAAVRLDWSTGVIVAACRRDGR